MQFTFTKQLSSKNVQTLYKLLETENNVKIKNQPSNLYSNYCKNNNVLQSFCILNKDEVIGCAQLFFYLRLQGMLVGVIEDVIVKRGFRKNGIGKKLVIDLLEEAKKRNIKKVSLTSSIGGILLYQKLGFKERQNSFEILI